MKKPILAQALKIKLIHSKLLWGWLLLFSILVMFAISVSLNLTSGLCLAIVYALAALRWCQQHLGQSRIQQIQVNVLGELFLTNTLNQTLQVKVLAGSVVHPWLMIVHFEPLLPNQASSATPWWGGCWRWLRVSMWQTNTLLILPDQATEADLSAFRRWLRWGLTAADY